VEGSGEDVDGVAGNVGLSLKEKRKRAIIRA
jgi:hypothetical protein